MSGCLCMYCWRTSTIIANWCLSTICSELLTWLWDHRVWITFDKRTIPGMHRLYTEGNIGQANAAEVVPLNSFQDASDTNIDADHIFDCNIAYHWESISIIFVIRMFTKVSGDPDGHRNIVHAHIRYVHVLHIPSTPWSGLDSDPVHWVDDAETLSPDFGYATWHLTSKGNPCTTPCLSCDVADTDVCARTSKGNAILIPPTFYDNNIISISDITMINADICGRIWMDWSSISTTVIDANMLNGYIVLIHNWCTVTLVKVASQERISQNKCICCIAVFFAKVVKGYLFLVILHKTVIPFLLVPQNSSRV